MICDYIMDIEKEKELIGLQAQVSLLYELLNKDLFFGYAYFAITTKIEEKTARIEELYKELNNNSHEKRSSIS